MRWPPYQHLFFDCDSTLTSVEGIDVLAELTGQKEEVERLTNAAMDGKIDLNDVYGKRLDIVNPNRQQIETVHQIYKKNIVPDTQEIIALLTELGVNLYIISGGLAEPVTEFGIYLGIPRDRIRGVDVTYNKLAKSWWENQHGHTDEQYLNYNPGALTVSNGKAKVVAELLGKQKGRSLLIGDGSSDLMAQSAVDLFVGFGGVIARNRVQAESPIFLNSFSLAPLLALVLGPARLNELSQTKYKPLIDKANRLINTGAFTFNNERIKEKFNNAYQTVYPRTN